MTTKLRVPAPITMLQVSEIRVTLLGASPVAMARIAYMDNDSHTLGDTIYQAWSSESWELLKQLSARIEQDFAELLEDKSEWAEPEDEEEFELEGPTY